MSSRQYCTEMLTQFKKLRVISGVLLATSAGFVIMSMVNHPDSETDLPAKSERFFDNLRPSDGVRYSSSRHTFRDVQEVEEAGDEEFAQFDDPEVMRRLDSVVSDLRQVLPTRYLNGTVNPCWYGEGGGLSAGSLYCVPAFYLMGYPKCGTTELYNLLTLHPRFAKPISKEPHWWTNVKSLTGTKQHFEEYLRWFQKPSREIERDPRKVTADCSASTAWKTIFGQDVESYPLYGIPYIFSRLFPHAKFVVIMRDPVSHLYSRFWYNCKLEDVVSEKLQEKGPEIFNILARQHIEALSRCTQDTGNLEMCSFLLPRRAYISPLTHEEAAMVKGKECGYIGFADSIYHNSLKGWLQFIPRNRILVLRTEDMAKDTVSVAQSMFRFLDLGEMDEAELEKGIALFGHSNSQTETKSSNLTLANSTMELLQKFFHPHNAKLADLLEDDKFLWS